MAKIYRQSGSLTQLIDELEREKTGKFRTIDEIRSFYDNCKNSHNRILKKHAGILRTELVDLERTYKKLSLQLGRQIKERETLLRNELKELKATLAGNEKRNVLTRLFFFFWKKILTRRKAILDNSFEKELRKPFRKGFEKIESVRSEIGDRKTNAEKWVERYSASDIEEQKRTLSVLRKHKYLFLGAEGEEMVTRELSKLPDTYTAINDYRLEFSPPLYNRNNDDRIYSIQIDHVVVGPTGLYLVETKNWSKDSMENVKLFSPIKQLKRSSFAIFLLLNQAVRRGDIDDFSNHWGDKKISPKNVLCLINHKPNQEFQYVKILSENQIAHYVGNQRQVFSQQGVQSLAENLLSRIA